MTRCVLYAATLGLATSLFFAPNRRFETLFVLSFVVWLSFLGACTTVGRSGAPLISPRFPVALSGFFVGLLLAGMTLMGRW